jgi:hypothetical protein
MRNHLEEFSGKLEISKSKGRNKKLKKILRVYKKISSIEIAAREII